MVAPIVVFVGFSQDERQCYNVDEIKGRTSSSSFLFGISRKQTPLRIVYLRFSSFIERGTPNFKRDDVFYCLIFNNSLTMFANVSIRTSVLVSVAL